MLAPLYLVFVVLRVQIIELRINLDSESFSEQFDCVVKLVHRVFAPVLTFGLDQSLAVDEDLPSLD